jgi:hypothetical protein
MQAAPVTKRRHRLEKRLRDPSEIRVQDTSSCPLIATSIVTLPSPWRERAPEVIAQIWPTPYGVRTESVVDGSMRTSDNAGGSGPKPFRRPVSGRLLRFRYSNSKYRAVDT